MSYNYLDVLNIGVKEGRGFSPQFQGDSLTNVNPGGPLEQTIGSVILNERAVKDLGIAPPAIGKQLLWDTDGDTSYFLNIVGIAKDFHFTSLRNEIKPFAFMVNPRAQGTFIVKLSGQNISGAIAQIESKWKQFQTERAFEYSISWMKPSQNCIRQKTGFKRFLLALLSRYTDRLPGIIRSCDFCRTTKSKRNRNSQSTGCIGR